MREQVAPAGVKKGYCLKYDVSLRPQDYYRCVEATRQQIAEATTLSDWEKKNVFTTGYGHVGDGNLHLNMSIPGYEDHDFGNRLNDVVDKFVMEFVRDHKGSVSAEHGIGLQKVPYLNYSKSDDMIRIMKQIKGVFDPNGIMNPYKLLD